MADDRDIELRISADDQASRKLEDVADIVEDLGDGTTEVEIDADTREAESRLEKFERELDELTSGSGRELRIDFRQQVLEGQIRSALRALERLEDPVDIRVKQDELESAQTELRDLAELADRKYDVQLDVDPKRNAKRAADDVDQMRLNSEGLQSGIGPLRGFTDELGGTAGNAGIAAAAMIDAGEAVEIFGGQLGFSQDKLAKLSLAIGGAGIAAAGLVAAYGRANRSNESAKLFEEEAVEGYTDALKDAESAVDGIATALRDAGDLKINFDGFFEGDLLPVLNEAGLGVDEFAQLVEGGQPVIDAWAESMKEAGVDAGLVDLAVLGAAQQHEFYAEAADNAAASNKFFADQAQDADRKTGGMRSELAASALEMDRMRAEATDAARAVEDVADEVTGLDRVLGVLDAEEAAIRLAQDFDAVRESIAEGTDSADDQRLKIIDLQQAVGAYIDDLGGVPDEIATEILAKINAGDLAGAEAQLNQVARRRTAEIAVEAVGLGDLIRRIQGSLGSIGAGLFPVGERTYQAPSSVNVYLPNSSAGPDVVRAVDRWARVNGRP